MELKKGYKQTEVGLIPNDWDAPKLGEIFTFKNGLNKAKEFFGYGTPIVNYMDVYGSHGIFIHELQGRVSLSKQELKNFEVRKGDVFFTRTSETADEVGMTSVMLDEPKNTVFSGFVLRARPKNDTLDDQFKKYCFSASYVRKQITSKSTETTRALTNGRYLSAVTLARPSSAEQRAIAAALSDVDGLIGGLEQLIAKKRGLKQAAMQQLLTGKKRLAGFRGEWAVRCLGEVADVKTGPFGSSLHESDYVRDGTPIITVEHLSEFGVDHVNLPLVSDSDRQRLRAYSLEIGDIVFSRVGSVDRNALIRPAEEGWLFSGRLLRVRPDKQKAFAPFLSYYFHGETFIGLVRNVAVGQTMPCLNTHILKGISVRLPSVAEQTTIAEILSDMDAELAALEQRRTKTRAIKQGVMQELLTGKTRLV